jgi:hypothetical protein
VVVALALGASGCGGSSSYSAGALSSPAGPSPTTSSTASSPTAPAAPAASGPRIALTRLTARAPVGWLLDHSFGKEIVFASDQHFANEFTYSDTSIYPGTSLAGAERIVSRNDDWTGAPKVGSRVTIDGATFFHLFGPAGQGRWYDVYASPDHDRLLQLGFRTDVPLRKRERLIASVLASVRLR